MKQSSNLSIWKSPQIQRIFRQSCRENRRKCSYFAVNLCGKIELCKDSKRPPTCARLISTFWTGNNVCVRTPDSGDALESRQLLRLVSTKMKHCLFAADDVSTEDPRAIGVHATRTALPRSLGEKVTALSAFCCEKVTVHLLIFIVFEAVVMWLVAILQKPTERRHFPFIRDQCPCPLCTVRLHLLVEFFSHVARLLFDTRSVSYRCRDTHKPLFLIIPTYYAR